MRRALEALLAVVIATLALPSPLVAYLPAAPGPTAEELTKSEHQFDEATWEALRVSESMDAPVVEKQEPLGEDDWNQALVDCAFALPTVDGISSSAEGVFFYPKGRGFDPETELALYECAVVHPLVLEGESLSLAQLHYLHGYFARWVVPCLVRNGYRLAPMPDLATFVQLHGDWSPYWALLAPDGSEVQGPTELELVTTACGTDRPGL